MGVLQKCVKFFFVISLCACVFCRMRIGFLCAVRFGVHVGLRRVLVSSCVMWFCCVFCLFGLFFPCVAQYSNVKQFLTTNATSAKMFVIFMPTYFRLHCFCYCCQLKSIFLCQVVKA